MYKALVIFFFLPVACFAQVPEPFKKANLILVTYDTMSVNNAFKQVGRTLLDMGYTISKSDQNFQTVETNIRQFPAVIGKIQIVVRASIKTVEAGKTEVKLSGLLDATNPPTEIANRGMKNSPLMLSFNKLQEVANKLKSANPSTITYAFQ